VPGPQPSQVARENRGLPRGTCQSAALTDAASTLTRTSSDQGACHASSLVGTLVAYREVTVTVEDDTLPRASVASALRVYDTRAVFGTVQAQA
jgi:hypothetical protein